MKYGYIKWNPNINYQKKEIKKRLDNPKNDIVHKEFMKDKRCIKDLISRLRPGDELIVYDLSHLGDNNDELLLILKNIQKKGAILLSIKQEH